MIGEEDSTVQSPAVLDIAVATAGAADVDVWLDALCAAMLPFRPGRSAEELRDELQNRLDALAAAYRELGGEHNEAANTAYRQLQKECINSRQQPIINEQSSGRTERAGRRTRSAQATNTRTGSKLISASSFLTRATLLPLGMFSLFYAADVSGLSWRVWMQVFGSAVQDNFAAVQTGAMTLANTNEYAFYRFELFVVPLVVGLTVGLLQRRKAFKSVFGALALLAIPAILLPGLIMGLSFAGMHDGIMTSFIPSAGPGVCGVGFWLCLGLAGAAAGSWLRHPRLPKMPGK